MKLRSTLTGSIKMRITLVMTALLVINTATAAASWALNARAARFADQARSSLAVAQAVQSASESVTEFVSDNRALAFSVSRDSKSEYSSEDYGQVIGSERLASHEIARVAKLVPGTAATTATRQWESLRELSYAWVNAEAEHAGASLRMSRSEKGGYRASVSSTIEPPAELVSAGLEQFGREVTEQGNLLRNATLRALVNDASVRATAAMVAEAEARQLARSIVLGLVALSLAAAVVASVWLYRTIVTPVTRARHFADKVAAGDLTATLEHHTADEIGVLTHAIEAMKENLVSRMLVMQELAGAVMVTAEDVGDAATRALALSGSEDLARKAAVPDDLHSMVGRTRTLKELAAQMLSL